MKSNHRFITIYKIIMLCSLLTMPLSVQANESAITLIHAGKLLAVPGKGMVKQQTLVIKNGIISAIEDGYKTPPSLGFSSENVTVKDLRNGFVLPGLIDMHTHITDERDPNKNRHQWTTLYGEDAAFNAIAHLQNTLMAGFTTVRNLGSEYKLMSAIKRAINKNLIKGPRIVAAMSWVTPTGGHGERHGYRTDIEDTFGKSLGVCDGADDCRRAVRNLVKNGADVIKITATGGVLSNTNTGVGQQLTDDELISIVQTAHSLGRKVAAHAHSADGINAALRAGVDSIEHGSYLTDKSVALFNKSGAYLVPTLLAGVSVYEEMALNDKIPQPIVNKIKQVLPAVEVAFRRAVKANVKMAFGTDSGVSKHGLNSREFELMVKYGMDNELALKTATVNAADLIGLSDTIGTLEIGKAADIISVQGDPLQDISVMMAVSFVMKDGVVFKE